VNDDGSRASPSSAEGGRATRLALLSVLYFAQGLPFGFQATALPVYLRASGVSVAAIGFLGLLSAPWMLKVLWAPLVDRRGPRRFGRRKSWIVPLQAALAAAATLAAFVDPERQLAALLALVFAMNLFAATQDIAVDGLAIDTLRPNELGPGNAVQVVGYKLGMLTGGGLLVWASASIGWRGLFLAMAGLSLAVLAVAAVAPERGSARERAPRDAADDAAEDAAAVTDVAARDPGELRRVLALAARAVRAPGAPWLLAVVATYKFGESMSDVLYKPFLVDSGLTPATIGFWAGTWGVVASLLGSLAGGVAAARWSPLGALGATAALRVLPLLGRWWLATSGISTGRFAAVTLAEELCGGALTTVLFTLMMARVDRRIGATHYTLLASVEVAGKLPGGALGGLLVGAGGWSYAQAFLLATALSLLFLPLLPRLRALPD
jgi:MFS transporter, PAT family, beta-lactamase induction signal transducer AmpG